jgi:hypothetical protein
MSVVLYTPQHSTLFMMPVFCSYTHAKILVNIIFFGFAVAKAKARLALRRAGDWPMARGETQGTAQSPPRKKSFRRLQPIKSNIFHSLPPIQSRRSHLPEGQLNKRPVCKCLCMEFITAYCRVDGPRPVKDTGYAAYWPSCTIPW